MQNLKNDNTCDYFLQLSGENDPNVCLKYCQPAIRTLTSKLKDKSIVVDDVPELYTAAACLAFYKYILADKNNSYSSIKAGELVVGLSPAEQKACAMELLTMTLSEAAPYLKTSVVFKSTGV